MPDWSVADVAKGLLLFFATKFVVDSVVRYRRGYAAIKGSPGRHVLFIHPFRTLARVIASVFPPRGYMGNERAKFSLYAKSGSTVLSGLLVTDGSPHFWFADAEAIKIITSDRHTYRKETEAYEVLEIYGRNLVSTDGNEWRRHRAVAGPAFNEANYAYAWSETVRITKEWFAEMDEDPAVFSSEGKVVDAVKVMTQATLLIISAAGFGQRTPWSAYSFTNIKDELASYDFSLLAKSTSPTSPTSSSSPSSNTHPHPQPLLPFHISLILTLDKLFTKILTPSILYALPITIPWLTHELDVAKVAFEHLRVHMLELVGAARAGAGVDGFGGEVKGNANGNGNGNGANILSRLVQANDAMQAEVLEEVGSLDGKRVLTDVEMLSNVFTFLLAGHETSAHTLSFAFLLLALNPDKQQKLREETIRVWPNASDAFNSNYKEDFDKLIYTLATFRETLRLHPAVPIINKIATTPVTLPALRFTPTTAITAPTDSYDGDVWNNVRFGWDEGKVERIGVGVPEGSNVTVDVLGVQMNPLVWGEDAYMFKPERFIDTDTYRWPRDGFLAFSAGPRGCIGSKFSTVESVVLLALLIRHYEILLPPDHAKHGGADALRRHMLKWNQGITMTPVNPAIRLRKVKDVGRV